MVATHTIKCGGKWYKAGDNVPENYFLASSVGYTKTDINRMSTADLQKLAGEKGIENADSFSGADLKKMLIELMNL